VTVYVVPLPEKFDKVPRVALRSSNAKSVDAVLSVIVAVVEEPAATVVRAGAIETLGRDVVVTGTSTEICKLKSVCVLPAPWLAP
jgi:hypothetical protein